MHYSFLLSIPPIADEIGGKVPRKWDSTQNVWVSIMFLRRVRITNALFLLHGRPHRKAELDPKSSCSAEGSALDFAGREPAQCVLAGACPAQRPATSRFG